MGSDYKIDLTGSIFGLTLFLMLALAIGSCTDREPDAPSIPVVIYLVDTLRADRLGIYGYAERITSPQLDKLVADSVVFEQAYAPASWTNPSVASLLTSTFACEHGMVTTKQRLDTSLVPLAERLHDIGYHTGAFLNNPDVGKSTGLARGYVELFEGNDTPDGWLTEISRFLAHPGERPGFAYIHTIEPRDVNRTPNPLIQKFGFVDMNTRKRIQAARRSFNKTDQADVAVRQAPGTTVDTDIRAEALYELGLLEEPFNILYDASVLWADQNVGNAIAMLKDRGLWDESIFIFLSDHGEEIGDHGGWFHGQSVYEELVRVPLLIHFPNGEFAGQRVTTPVSLVDVMPTILDYVGVTERCEDCRGNSVLPLLRNPGDGSEPPVKIAAVRINRTFDYQPWRRSRGDVNVVVRKGKWKGIWNDDLQTLELYDSGEGPCGNGGSESVSWRSGQANRAKGVAVAAGLRRTRAGCR